jgi:GT2 family glycosyltransferase
MNQTKIAHIIPWVWSKDTLQNVLAAIKSIEIAVAGKDKIDAKIIVVVNNAPSSVTETSLKKLFSKQESVPVSFLLTQINKGFTGAVNDAIAFAQGKWNPGWYLVLNDDAALLPNFYDKVLPLLTTKYHIVSSKIQRNNGDIESNGLKRYKSGLSFPITDEGISASQQIACGTCLLLSKELVEQRMKEMFGFVLNPMYFAYNEDVELSLWANRRFTNPIAIVDSPLVVHKGSQTAKRGSSHQLFLGFRNTIWTMLQYESRNTVINNFFNILLGQMYMILLSLYKGYFLLYPKIIKQTIKNYHSLQFLRASLHHER